MRGLYRRPRSGPSEEMTVGTSPDIMKAMLRRFLLLVSAVLLAACATSALPPVSQPSVPRSRPRPPSDIGVLKMLARGGTLAAASRNEVLAVHTGPGTERPYQHLAADNPWGQPLRLLVVRDTIDDEGDVWLRIQLPIWPNGQEGWVQASDVRLARATERVVVDLSARRLVRLREGKRVARLRVAIGKAATPTPPGRYFVWARVGTGRPSGPYGSYILGLSGFSESIEPWTEWPGQPRLAIHGTDDPADAGHAVSNGCIRVLNRLLRVLHDVPMGTPVLIRR
jgi:lipoprotein-anchoring transpeptidase ErfK/SrfK